MAQEFNDPSPAGIAQNFPMRCVEFAIVGGLWSLAVALLYTDLKVFPVALSPLASAYFDGIEAITGVIWTGLRILIPSLAIYTLVGLPLAWLTRYDLRAAAPVAPLATILAAEDIGVRSFLSEILPSAALLAALIYWASRAGERTQRWFYVWLPASLAGVSIVGLLYSWLSHYSLREPLGKEPLLSLAVFLAACLLVAFPALRYLKGAVARVLLLLVLVWFVSLHSFDANFPIHASEPMAKDSTPPPHVILIVVDTLRADALSYQHPDAPATPFIDSLAEESVVFANAISSSSWTFPAMASLMTGLAPLKSLAGKGSTLYQYGTVQKPTIAQVLHKHGYDTRAIVGNHLLCRPFQVAAGFQRIETYAIDPFGNPTGWGLPQKREDMHSVSTRLLTDQAIEWTHNLTDQPSFLWLHYLDPHGPYLPPSEFTEPIGDDDESNDMHQKRRLYRGEVRFVDNEIGRLLDALKRQGVYEKSIIILTSDHGESFLEHGEMAHGTDLYQELLHVPLLIRMPGGTMRKTVANHVPLTALLATITDLLKLEEPPQTGQAVSLAALIETEQAGYDYPIVSGANLTREPQWSIVMDGMKYIYREQTGREEVYDLASDPGERRSLDEPPSLFVSRARQALEQHLEFAEATLERDGMAPNKELDETLRGRLKALGYIQ